MTEWTPPENWETEPVGFLVVQMGEDRTPSVIRDVYSNPDGVLSLRPWRKSELIIAAEESTNAPDA